MKFHSLHLRNIKCLSGDHYINFDSLVGENGVFLVYGNIGTGKTAIFDAISLALYNETPQLKGGFDPEKAKNSRAFVMNHDASEAFIRFDFSLVRPSGVRQFYRAEWSMKKSKSGNYKCRRGLIILDSDFRERHILCADCDTKKIYDPAFEAVLCGLSFADFTRSVMLPQNSFSTFLDEPAKGRIDILEGISDTSIVSSILGSVKTHVDQRSQALKDLQKEAERLPTKIQYQQAKQQIQNIASKQVSLESLLESVDLVNQLGQHQQHHDRLSMLLAKFATDLPNDEVQIQENQKRLGQLNHDLIAQEVRFTEAESLRAERLVRYSALVDIQNNISAQQHMLRTVEHRIMQQEAEHNRLTQQLGRGHVVEDERYERRLQSSLTQLRATLDLDLHDSFFEAVQNRSEDYRVKLLELDSLQVKRGERRDLQNKLQAYTSALVGIRQDISEKSQQSSLHTEELNMIERLFGDLERRIDLSRQALEPYSLRDQLVTGEPCMVCGATEHPFLHEAANRDELEASYQKLLKERKELHQRVRTLTESKQELETELARLRERESKGSEHVDGVKLKISELNESYQNILSSHGCQSLADVDRLYNSFTRSASNIQQLYASYEHENQAFQKYTQARQQWLNAEQEIRQISGRLAEERRQRDQYVHEVEQLTISLEAESAIVCEAWGMAATTSMSDIRAWIEEDYSSIKGSFEQIKIQRQSLESVLKTLCEKLERDKQQSEAHRSEIEQNKIIIEQNSAALAVKIHAVQESNTGYLAVDRAPEELYDDIKSSAQLWREERDALLRAKRESVQVIEVYENGRAIREKMIEVKQDTEYWVQLYKTLNKPSGVGGNFREYVQALFLQRLIDTANKHLREMAPSYRLLPLIKSNGFPYIDFLVSKNLGEGLPVTTLSGGERFLTSLALALSLSSLRSINLPIETILIDEGFGSLDNEHVDSVIQGLEALQNSQSSVRIGLISHVEGMVDRIQSATTVAELSTSQSAESIKREETPVMDITDFESTYGVTIDNQVGISIGSVEVLDKIAETVDAEVLG